MALKPFHQVLYASAFLFFFAHFTGPIAYFPAAAIIFFLRNPIRKHFSIPGSDFRDMIASVVSAR